MQNNELDILENLELNIEEDLENETKLSQITNEDIIENTQDLNVTGEGDMIIFEQEDDNTKIVDEIKLPENTNENIENIEVKNVEVEKVVDTSKNKYSIISGIIFLFKYLLTSSLIFGILLFTTNYSAYINIIRSTIFAEELNTEKKGILNSVEASNIKEKFREDIKKNNELSGKENNGTSEYSLRKLVNNSNKNNLDIDIEITPYENRIIIPKIGKNIPLIDIENKKMEGNTKLDDIFMKELEKGVVRYPGSSKPGEDGITFIFGHSSNFPWVRGDFNDVFSLLDKVEFEDEIILYYNQKKYKYKIREKKVITPGDVSVLKRDKKKSELTLMTCWPLGTTLNRLIVTGELID